MNECQHFPPIFILSHSRAGSTLVRYVVDTHPQVCCPPEIDLGQLCSCMYGVVTLTSPWLADRTQSERHTAVTAAIRDHVENLMQPYCAAKQKVRWADKSISNIDRLEILEACFPNAQYICLYRNCMDVVHSCLEMCRFGFIGRLGEFVSKRPYNLVEAMAESWCQRTAALLSFEKRNAIQCLRMRYEDIVRRPRESISELFTFLKLEFDESILDAAFRVSHDAGPGDLKIEFMSNIHADSIGKGATIPRIQMSRATRVKMRRLSRALGYEEDEQVSVKNSQSPEMMPEMVRNSMLSESLKSYLSWQVMRQANRFQRLGDVIELEVALPDGGSEWWHFDPKSVGECFKPGRGMARCSLRVSQDDLPEFMNGLANPAEALFHAKLRIAGDTQLGLEALRLLFKPAIRGDSDADSSTAGQLDGNTSEPFRAKDLQTHP